MESWMYSTDLFERETVQAICERLKRLAGSGDSRMRIGGSGDDRVAEREQEAGRQVLVEWNSYRVRR